MKNKGIGLILSFLIFISNTGLAFNVHYCGNEVSSISLKTNFCFRVRPTILGRQWSQVDIVVGWGQCDQMAR